MSESEKQKLEDIETQPVETARTILSQQELLKAWANEVVETPYTSTKRQFWINYLKNTSWNRF